MPEIFKVGNYYNKQPIWIKNSPLRAVNVLRYRAEAQYWSGSEEDAIKSMLHAQRLAKGNQAMSARIDSRLKQMQDERRMKI